ncbi:MAG: ribonucleoside triphosphate reductase [Syntrophales bacterium]|jgi:ribonucleoside-triphosphate reductase|nr:ribonucleoside triphosphate reductase [Syntrophales bacterium]MCK9528573.1 ribonucleoside triphosphate reductase [Syntrophales bacterium]MDX9922791.1 ribonucleoside triphosphate reductase [Syntrophales bacterium]
MHTVITKRDGREVPFVAEKITAAIARAGAATEEFDEKTALRLTIRVLNLADTLFRDAPLDVEGIQDIVEEVLLDSPYRKTAKAYIIYRDQHARLREIANTMEVDLVDQYLKKTDWKINENSNMDFSLQGLNNYISSEVSKVYWLNKIYTPEIKQAQVSGDFHIHDLSLLSVYCVGWDLYNLLLEGFRGASGKVESRPARHLRSALGQVVNFFYTLQGEAAGAQAFSNFDTLLAPFIRYDGLSRQEVRQALQEFIFNINVPTRVGFQTPFTNVTLDVRVPSFYANQNVIVGGEPRAETYGDFQEEMNLFNRAFLEVMAEGDAKGRVFTFPIPTYNITKDFDWDDKNLEYLWEMTAKYGVPYFSNFINSDMNPEDARSMCCRLRIDNRELEKRGGGLFGSNPLTGSIGVITINMPRIGYLSGTEEEFLQRLDRLMVMAKDSLETKRKVLESYTEGCLYPYTKHYLAGIRERFGEYWKNHFSTIGLVGMNEATLNFMGVSIGDPRGLEFARRVLDYMRDRLVDFQRETGNNFNLEATPAEGTSYGLARLDRRKYPDIIFANGRLSGSPGSVLEREVFYTNSTQLPVNYTDDIFEALDLQDDIQTRYTGGTVFHIFAGERTQDPGTIKSLIRKICRDYRLPYFTFSPTFSVCGNHGYLPGEKKHCPSCGEACEVYSRVVGYLRPVKQWNKGKQAEYGMRKPFAIPLS